MTQTDIDQIHSLVHEGNKLAAVKLLMDTAHIGLKEAKDIIDDFFLGKLTDLEAAVAQAKTRYSDTYESISASSDPDGSNVHFFYQKGNHREEVTPGHPMWERVRSYYTIAWDQAPEEVNKAREPLFKAVLDLEAKTGYIPKKGTQTTSSTEKKDSLFIKKSPFDFFKWYFYFFIAAIIIYIVYLIIGD
ncbi:MAG: 50S ribosomal protein L7/L12 [Capnocytophaga granulosa]